MMTTEERFWSKVDSTSDCWLWTAGVSGDGYGAFKVQGRQVGAHRLAYELSVGPIPDGLQVLHHCDTPICVNPFHLFLGTHADNMADKARKGRSSVGERNPRGRLTEASVRDIRARFEAGASVKELATSYGVGLVAIYRIVRRVTWQGVQ